MVHLAAMTDVDGCEAQPDRAERINHAGTRNITGAAADHGVRVIYVSTDYVFDGEKGTEYIESDDPNPLNVYGRTKLAGESEVAKLPDHWILRSSWIWGEGRNFIRTIIHHAQKGQPLRIVDDQVGRPTSSTELAKAIAELITKEGEGVIHVAGDGEPCSWADLAEFALGEAGMNTSVERITTEAYERQARGLVASRPLRSVLSLQKSRALGLPLLDWRVAVSREIGTFV